MGRRVTPHVRPTSGIGHIARYRPHGRARSDRLRRLQPSGSPCACAGASQTSRLSSEVPVVAANLTPPTAADAALTYPARESAAPVTGDRPADVVTDVIVIGGGGLPTALFSRWLCNEVVLLEKAPEVGGTARKAAFW